MYLSLRITMWTNGLCTCMYMWKTIASWLSWYMRLLIYRVMALSLTVSWPNSCTIYMHVYVVTFILSLLYNMRLFCCVIALSTALCPLFLRTTVHTHTYIHTHTSACTLVITNYSNRAIQPLSLYSVVLLVQCVHY